MITMIKPVSAYAIMALGKTVAPAVAPYFNSHFSSRHWDSAALSAPGKIHGHDPNVKTGETGSGRSLCAPRFLLRTYSWILAPNKIMNDWLVVSTPLKNISQLGVLFPIYGKIKNVPNHQAERMPKEQRPGSAKRNTRAWLGLLFLVN